MSPARNRRLLIFLVALFVVLVLALLLISRRSSLSQSRSSEVAIPRLLASFTENGVYVEIRLEKDSSGLNLVATYRPTNEHYHLYSKDLPHDGLDGVGRPTLLQISGNGIESSGVLLESVAPIKLNAAWSQEPVPVYPEGSVTLRLPIRFLIDTASPIAAEISLTYMTCSDTLCLPPVEGKVIPVTIRDPNE